MDSTDDPIVASDSSERELIEKLLDSSEESQEIEGDFDRVVFTSSWDEVACGWKRTAPNVRYISSAGPKKKTSKEKFWRVSPDSESHYAKVKRLAGMITNSNSNANNSVNEMNNTKAGGKWPGNKTIKTNMRNFQNADVLSYDTPCWRYIIDPRTLKYVERTPLQVLRNMASSHKYLNQTLVLENGGMITFQETSNGGIAISDPALAFDRRLLETLDLKDEFRVDKAGRFHFSFESSVPLITQYRSEDNKIKVIHTVPTIKENPVISFCELCRFRTHDTCLSKADCRLEICTNSSTELKPLQKITPTQRQTAEESILATKALMSQSKLKSDSSSCLKACRKSKEGKAANQKRKTGPGGEGKLDWLPITRNTIGYPYPSTTLNQAHSKFPERPSAGFSKAFSLPRHNKKGKKLTLSEAASLVPSRGKLDDALEKLTQELDRKVDKGVTFSEPLLPSVSGTKLEVPALANCDN
ncbi:hypothetical protein ACROYT_G012910 [Oculina patagonica]